MNSKRVYRIYVEEKLVVRRRPRRRRICVQTRVLLSPPSRPNETWTMDFLHDALASGRKLRTLSIEDAYTREMLAIEVDTSLPSLRVVRVLERLRMERGLPERIVIDHGTEFTSKTLDQWAYENRVTLHFITPAVRWRTATSNRSTAGSVGSASTSTGFSRWTMRERPSKAGGSITTRYAHTVRWAIERRKNSQWAMRMWKANTAFHIRTAPNGGEITSLPNSTASTLTYPD